MYNEKEIKELLKSYHINNTLKKTLQEVIIQCNEDILSVNAILNLLDNKTYQTILVSKFILNLSINEIADITHYSVRHTQRLYAQAIEQLTNKLGMTS